MQSILYRLANECMASLFGGGEAAYAVLILQPFLKMIINNSGVTLCD